MNTTVIDRIICSMSLELITYLLNIFPNNLDLVFNFEQKFLRDELTDWQKNAVNWDILSNILSIELISSKDRYQWNYDIITSRFIKNYKVYVFHPNFNWNFTFLSLNLLIEKICIYQKWDSLDIFLPKFKNPIFSTDKINSLTEQVPISHIVTNIYLFPWNFEIINSRITMKDIIELSGYRKGKLINYAFKNPRVKLTNLAKIILLYEMHNSKKHLVLQEHLIVRIFRFL